MNFKQKVRFLTGYMRAKEKYAALAIQIHELEEMQLPNGIHYTDMPKHHSNDDQMANFGAEYWELIKEQEKCEKRMINVINTINQISDSDPLGCRLLTEQYIIGCPKYVIEEKLGMARETRRRWHNRAVEEIHPEHKDFSEFMNPPVEE